MGVKKIQVIQYRCDLQATDCYEKSQPFSISFAGRRVVTHIQSLLLLSRRYGGNSRNLQPLTRSGIEPAPIMNFKTIQNIAARLPLNKATLRHHIRPRSFGRFVLTGILNTAVGVLVFLPLYWAFAKTMGINLVVALSYILSTSCAFLSHKFITFQSRGAYHTEGGKYFALAGITYLLNIAILDIVLQVIPHYPIVAQISISLTLAVANYFGMNRLVFASFTTAALKKWFARTMAFWGLSR
jgi:putative flippase GtrA